MNLIQWATNWQKDPRFTRNYTEKLIKKACSLDTQLCIAYRQGSIKVIAGPHRKAGQGGGGDARLHMTLQPAANASCWHVILDDSGTYPKKVEKRERLGHRF
ncbi:MAG: hypothetical protein XXXJIFNMEKO3_02728 [Candidatus Erwinia impunctatus]|nr:hypothetical protein XXXJIFNMEKO_02728 [Culicoides impunctatus]